MDRKLVVWTGGVLAFLALGALVYVWRTPEQTRPLEVHVRPIPMTGGPEATEAELSGLAWYGDTLVLMPQYPRRVGDRVFTIERARIEAWLDGDDSEPLEASAVPLDTAGVQDAIAGFDGFEAIAFVDQTVFFTVEGQRDETPHAGWVLRGRVEGNLERIVIEPERHAPIAPQNELANTGYEALVVHAGRVLALYETNGEVNPGRRVMAFDSDLTPVRDVALEPIEYRVTDATAVDAEGHFWVSNYHWPGAPWEPGVCTLTERYGEGESHARCATVERLVELRITDRGVQTTDHPPLQLELIDDDHARNWEGVVRLGRRGFLIVTDEHPETILGFVPLER